MLVPRTYHLSIHDERRTSALEPGGVPSAPDGLGALLDPGETARILLAVSDPAGSRDEIIRGYIEGLGDGRINSPGELLAGGFLAWCGVCGVAAWLGGGRAVWDLHRPLLLGAGYTATWALWAPARLAGRVLERDVPPLTFAAFAGFFRVGPRRVDDRARAELVRRTTVDPAMTPAIEALEHGYHTVPGGIVEAVHKVTIGETGSAKNQADINYELQHQLEYSDEHVVAVSPKDEFARIVCAYARPTDRIFLYTFHPGDSISSALDLLGDADRLADLAYMICHEPDARDSHWNEKAAELIEAVALELTDPKARARGQVTANLAQVRDVVADKRRLAELKKRSPIVGNVADEDKEWGHIRSTASRRLKALSSPALRRIFAATPGTEQPFSRGPGRTIVIMKPYPASAKRLDRYVTAVQDRLFRLAGEDGLAGGPGTKMIVDELASYMRPDHIDEWLDLGRDSRVQVSYVLQSVGQLEAKMDRGKARHLISSTELKVIGRTSDSETARTIAELSGPETVEYRGPRQDDEDAAPWLQHVRLLVEPHEITQQQAGEFTIQHGPSVRKVAVAEEHYHWRQAREARERVIRGVVDPESYAVPPLLGAEPRPERGEPGNYDGWWTAGGVPAASRPDAQGEAEPASKIVCGFCNEANDADAKLCRTCGDDLRTG